MKAPQRVCLKCGKIHWGSCAAIDVSPVEVAVSVSAINRAMLRDGMITETDLGPKPKKRAPRGTFDRNAYQRDLMRKRRAKPKDQE